MNSRPERVARRACGAAAAVGSQRNRRMLRSARRDAAAARAVPVRLAAADVVPAERATSWATSSCFTPTLAHYRALWTGKFPASFVNSCRDERRSTALALLIGVPAAYALSRGGFGRVAPHRAVDPRHPHGAADRLHDSLLSRLPLPRPLIDTLTGLVIIYLTFNLALVIWMMQPFFDSVPRELEEAAWIDGCRVWGAFRRVTLPLSAPGLAATAVICFILSWNDFFYALILTRTNAMTAPVAIVNFMPVQGLGVGQDRRGGHAGDAAGRRLLHLRAQLPGARPRGGRRQGVSAIAYAGKGSASAPAM